MKLGFALGALLLAAAPSVTHAEERAMFVNVGGTAGIGGPTADDDQYGEADAEGVLIGRLFASWEPAPLPYKEPKGYRWRGQVAPEVIVGRIRIADHRTGSSEDNSATFVALGGRVELGYSQHKGGLLQVSARGAVYLAGRVGLLGTGKTPILEGGVGQYFFLGDSARIGYEVGVLGLLPTQTKEPEWQIRPVSARGPWLDNSGDHVSAVATVYLGFKL